MKNPGKKKESDGHGISRRKFVGVVAGAAAGMTIKGANSSYNLKPISPNGTQERPDYLGDHWASTRKNNLNVILLIIDTLRYDALGTLGSRWIQTPNFDRLANKSRIFEYAFANSFPTIPMRTDTITGQYGYPFNPWLPLLTNVTTLPQVLAKAGYCTQLIHDTPHLVNGGHSFDWPFHAWTQIRGAEVDRPWIDDSPFTYLENWSADPIFDFLGEPDLKESSNKTMFTYTRANRNRSTPQDWNSAKLFLTASRFLQDNASRDNFFLWIDSFDPHEPWDAPPEFVNMYVNAPGYDGRIDPRALWGGPRQPGLQERPEAIERIKAYYAAKVTHLDRWFGDFLDTLEETGLDKNTVLILTADHGTRLGEKGQFGKRGYAMGEPEAHVPMMVYVPGLGPGKDNRLVQPQDIFSTILGITGISKPHEVDGLDMFASDDSKREVAMIGGRGGDYRIWKGKKDKLIFTVFSREWILKYAPKKEVCELYKYGSEKENLASSNPGIVEELREAATDELARQGLHPHVIEWLKCEGEASFPEGYHTLRETPENWMKYWTRNYTKW
jgi:arylsulfatase A-like enzyme